jgi:hypothetical protein
MRLVRLLTATFVALGVSLTAAPSASAAGIILLPTRGGNFKTILIRTVAPGEWAVRADFTVTNTDRTDLIWCALWGNPKESAGDQKWQRLDFDQVRIGSTATQMDADIHLEATADSVRRFQVKVQCGHNLSGFRPIVEPGATLQAVWNLNV